jgi:hypothetical protein
LANRTIDHVLRHESKKDDVSGKHYIKPDLKQIRKVMKKVERMYKAVEKKNKRRKN